MYQCYNCCAIFEKPDIEWVNVGVYYGVDNPYGKQATIEVCPCCGCEEFQETYEDWEEEDE